MTDLHLSISFNAVVLLLLALVAALISWFIYRVTVPPVSSSVRILLAVLRCLALYLLVVFIGEPLLSLLHRTVDPPTTVLLIDDSRSMTIKDRSGDRRSLLASVLGSQTLKTLSSIGAVQHAAFSTSTHFYQSFSNDSLRFTGDGTDIASSLRRVKEYSATANVQAVVLLSDGAVTVGSSPDYEAQDLGLPVFVVGIGDTSEQRDLLVRNVLTNAITYVGSTVPVNVTLKSSGYDGERVEVTLHDEGGILDRKVVTLGSGTREYSIPLAMTPNNEGLQKFTVDVSCLKDELTFENNRQGFFTKVLKSKMRVLLVAGAPSTDVAFIRRALESDKNIQVSSYIERGQTRLPVGQGQSYEGSLSTSVLKDAECLVLIGYPGQQSSTATLSALVEAVNGGKPVFFMLSRAVDYLKLRLLEPQLPFSTQGGNPDEYQAFFVVPDVQRNNAILKVGGAETTDLFPKLAPVFKVQMGFRAKPEAELLATTRIQNVMTNEPFLLSRNVNRKKSLALLGYGVWRWKMLTENIPSSETVLEEFMSNAVRWLTTRQDDRLVRVQPTRQSFGGQDPIDFAGQVYNETYQPVDDAQIVVTISGGARANEIRLSSAGSGQYEGSLESLPEGDYHFIASVRRDGKEIAGDRGTFAVGGLNLEFQETRMKKGLLEQLALRTGGRYYSPSSISSLATDIAALPEFKPRERIQSNDIELWNKSWMLGLVVGLFSIEWFIRKRNGML
jgi:hypothetical protein